MKKIIAIFIVTVAVVRCNTVSAIQDETNMTGVLHDQGRHKDEVNLVEFKVNGQIVRTSGWNICRFELKGNANQWLNITTNMHSEERTINVNLSGSVPGSYFVDESDPSLQSHAAFFPDYTGDMINSYSFIKGLFSITMVDTVRGVVNGTFYGTAMNQHGEILEITDGRIINGALQPGVRRY